MVPQVKVQRQAIRQSVYSGFATLITISPLVEFAIQYPDTLFDLPTELNIFKTTTPDQTESALLGNTKLHLLMFNYSGDAMNRHNAPGEAILEPVTGTAFALGAAVAIFYLARFEFVLIVAGFICALLGGILSKPVDLPTSFRTIDCSIFVFTVAAVAVSMISGS